MAIIILTGTLADVPLYLWTCCNNWRASQVRRDSPRPPSSLRFTYRGNIRSFRSLLESIALDLSSDFATVLHFFIETAVLCGTNAFAISFTAAF